MGYHSDVAIAMYTKDYNTMVSKAKALENQDIYDFIKSSEIYLAKEGKITILEWWDVKWFKTFNGIDWIESFIKKIHRKTFFPVQYILTFQ